MKFGRNLPRNQVPEWSESYINYKGLKKLIKAAAADAATNPKGPDLAEFFYSLDRNLENVDGFYNKKFAEASRRLKLLLDRYGRTPEVVRNLDRDEVEELMGAFLELRGQLRKIQWFGEVNRRGFIKITKKLDKKVTFSSHQKRYIESKVDIKPFATNVGLSEALNSVNDWLSALGEAENHQNNNDDNISVHSFHSLKRATSRTSLELPHEILDILDNTIRNDRVESFKQALDSASLDIEDPAAQRLLVSLLQRAISCKAKGIIARLLPLIKYLDATDDINQRNCLHRLVISIGRAKSQQRDQARAENALEADSSRFITPAAAPATVPPPSTLKESQLLSLDDESVKLLSYVLDTLEPHQRVSLKSKDAYGRLPLHYAAEYGFVVVCQLVMKRMQDWDQFNVEKGIDAPEWQDNEGLAPLHLSVINGHPLTTKALLEAENWKGQTEQKAMLRRNISKSSAVLSLATKANSTDIVTLLVNAGVDINWRDETGETALHVAARFGHVECAKILLAGSSDQKMDIEAAENSFAWTALHIAAVDGHLPVVELLIEAGAEVNKTDSSGWTAREHAALRGHLDIAKRLAEAAPSDTSGSESDDSGSTRASTPPGSSSLEERRSQASNLNSQVRMTEPVKTFGHRYLKDESMVLVSLGSMDVRKNVEAVKLDRVPLAEAHSTQLDTALSLVVSATGASGEPSIIDLPVQDNISTEPIVFHAKDAAKVKIMFDIVPTYSGSQENKIGRAVAVLSSIKPTLGVKRMNLQGDVSVPIVAASTLEVIGTVNFNFLVITPFSHPNMSITEKQTYWKSVSAPMVIGHRGLGKNMAASRSLQLGENTLQSFIAAANLGANYVEFDVQLTKDHVPVIYHDFLVSETGIDAPVHTLTLEQFLHVKKQTPRPSRPVSPSPRPFDPSDFKDGAATPLNGQSRPRSFSMSEAISGVVDPMDERMKHTRDFKAKGFKGNSSSFIQAPFTTLEELFLKVPENVGFNIEMKYPMLFESVEHDMDTYAVELNSFVDVVLKQVYDLGKKRNIIFSSFNPDICLLLSFKQPSIPILFLTDAGTSEVGDVRASSLQEAIRFASRWNLLGVVSAAEPLCNSPRLVRVVKEMGLVCVSYGTLNNNPDMVELQVKEGIDAVIVDSVLAIRKDLTKRATTKSPLPPSSGAQSDSESATSNDYLDVKK